MGILGAPPFLFVLFHLLSFVMGGQLTLSDVSFPLKGIANLTGIARLRFTFVTRIFNFNKQSIIKP